MACLSMVQCNRLPPGGGLDTKRRSSLGSGTEHLKDVRERCDIYACNVSSWRDSWSLTTKEFRESFFFLPYRVGEQGGHRSSQSRR